jgi:hypothetical protein
MPNPSSPTTGYAPQMPSSTRTTSDWARPQPTPSHVRSRHYEPLSSKKKFSLPWSKKKSADAKWPPPPPYPLVHQGVVDSTSSSTVSTAAPFSTSGSEASSVTTLSSYEAIPLPKIPSRAPSRTGHAVAPRPTLRTSRAAERKDEPLHKTASKAAPYVIQSDEDEDDVALSRDLRWGLSDDGSENSSTRSPSVNADAGAPDPGTPLPELPSRIPSMHFEGLSMDDIFSEFEKKTGRWRNGGGGVGASAATGQKKESVPLGRLSSNLPGSTRVDPRRGPVGGARLRKAEETPPPPRAAQPYKPPVRTSSLRARGSVTANSEMEATTVGETLASPVSIRRARSISLTHRTSTLLIRRLPFSTSLGPDENNRMAEGDLQCRDAPFEHKKRGVDVLAQPLASAAAVVANRADRRASRDFAARGTSGSDPGSGQQREQKRKIDEHGRWKPTPTTRYRSRSVGAVERPRIVADEPGATEPTMEEQAFSDQFTDAPSVDDLTAAAAYKYKYQSTERRTRPRPQPPVPLVIVTSPSCDGSTFSFLRENDYTPEVTPTLPMPDGLDDTTSELAFELGIAL